MLQGPPERADDEKGAEKFRASDFKVINNAMNNKLMRLPESYKQQWKHIQKVGTKAEKLEFMTTAGAAKEEGDLPEKYIQK